jgi:hypothetical protein
MGSKQSSSRKVDNKLSTSLSPGSGASTMNVDRHLYVAKFLASGEPTIIVCPSSPKTVPLSVAEEKLPTYFEYRKLATYSHSTNEHLVDEIIGSALVDEEKKYIERPVSTLLLCEVHCSKSNIDRRNMGERLDMFHFIQVPRTSIGLEGNTDHMTVVDNVDDESNRQLVPRIIIRQLNQYPHSSNKVEIVVINISYTDNSSSVEEKGEEKGEEKKENGQQSQQNQQSSSITLTLDDNNLKTSSKLIIKRALDFFDSMKEDYYYLSSQSLLTSSPSPLSSSLSRLSPPFSPQSLASLQTSSPEWKLIKRYGSVEFYLPPTIIRF